MVCVQNIPSKRVSPGVCPGLVCFFDLYIDYSGLGITNLHTDIARGKGVRWFRGLTCVFWAENAEKKCKSENNGKNKGDIQSLRPSDFAPAFGRAVGRCAAGLDAGLKPSSISEATARATA